MVRRSGRLAHATSVTDEQQVPKPTNDDSDNDDDGDDNQPTSFAFDGVVYNTYQDMVAAKRKRNENRLQESGLLSAVAAASKTLSSSSRTNGLKQRNGTDRAQAKSSAVLYEPRKSRRLAGIESDGRYIDGEKGGSFTVVDDINGTTEVIEAGTGRKEIKAGSAATTNNNTYRGRINDGSDISIQQAVENCDSKWIGPNSVRSAQAFLVEVLAVASSTTVTETATSLGTKKSIKNESPTSIVTNEEVPPATKTTRSSPLVELPSQQWVESEINKISADEDPSTDENQPVSSVAKICPDRIYGIAIHPSTNHLIVSAGDKQGYVGIWNVNHCLSMNSNNDLTGQTTTNTRKNNEDDPSVNLFRFHSSVAATLNWTSSGSALVSTSYDGTIRWFDAYHEKCEEIFAVYGDDAKYKDLLGFGMDEGYKYWIQFGCLDHRSSTDKCMFVSTSVGNAMHLDLRVSNSSSSKNGSITFHSKLSEKKINTLRYNQKRILCSFVLYSLIVLTVHIVFFLFFFHY